MAILPMSVVTGKQVLGSKLTGKCTFLVHLGSLLVGKVLMGQPVIKKVEEMHRQYHKFPTIAFRVIDVDHLTSREPNGSRSVVLEVAEEQEDGSYQVVFTGDYSLMTIDKAIKEFRTDHFSHSSRMIPLEQEQVNGTLV